MSVTNENGDQLDFLDVFSSMDKELCFKLLAMQEWSSQQEFYEEYCRLHKWFFAVEFDAFRDTRSTRLRQADSPPSGSSGGLQAGSGPP